MKLILNGPVSSTFVETLCLIFFPGAKFSGSAPDDGACAAVTLSEHDGTAYAEVTLNAFDREESASALLAFSDQPDEKRRSKTVVGEAFWQAGCRLLGSEPPFGILSGVRPTKIASQLLQAGHTPDEAAAVLRQVYHVTDRKASLVARVAETEASLLSSVSKDGCSLYLSIPFCPTRCAYCSFISYATPRFLSLIPDYLTLLVRDIGRMCQTIREEGKTIQTIYIGGGTPSILNEEQLSLLLKTIEKEVDLSLVREFTLEAGRPDTITKEKLQIAKERGVSRVSINPQTLSDEVLRQIGRSHTADDFRRAYAMAKQSGIPVINTDLIVGLPGDTAESFRATLDEIASLSPENVTVHSFTVKRSASLKEKGEAVYSYTGGDAPSCVAYAQDTLEEAGYHPYYLYRQKNTVGNLENVGYSRPGKEGLYNILIMEEVQNIYGVGAGAVTKRVGQNAEEKIVRTFEPKYPYEWMEEKKKAENAAKLTAPFFPVPSNPVD